MSEGHRIIPLSPVSFQRREGHLPKVPLPPILGPVKDQRGRPLKDLRISVIDQCNFRCGYCMPKEIFHKDYVFLARDELLSFAEMTRLARIFVSLGVEKLRITGGEPLLRKGLESLIAELADLKTQQGKPVEIALTTNGVLLAQKAAVLRNAGLHRVTVSLDALDPDRFRQMSGVPDSHPKEVLNGIEAAAKAGLKVKANMVVQRHVNDDEIVPMARQFRALGHILRFIEFMDVGNSNNWQLEQVVQSQEIIDRIHAVFPLVPVGRASPHEVSERWRYQDSDLEIGVISSISQPFCGECSRARISSEGLLYTCLFATNGVDLRGAVRNYQDDELLKQMIQGVWLQREDRYSELRSQAMKENRPQTRAKVEMSYIGG